MFFMVKLPASAVAFSDDGQAELRDLHKINGIPLSAYLSPGAAKQNNRDRNNSFFLKRDRKWV